MNLLNIDPKEFCSTHNACSEGASFAIQFKTMAEVWDNCPRADWMFWILARLNLAPKELRYLACDFAERVLPIYEKRNPNNRAPRKAVEMARRYVDGKATLKQVQEARRAAAYAAADAAYAAAAAAAYAAADAAYAADARTKERIEQANLVRAKIPNPFC